MYKFKQVVLGAVIVGLVGVLVFGAVNRTLARWESYDVGQGAQRHSQAGGYDPSGMPSGDARRALTVTDAADTATARATAAGDGVGRVAA
ncbi:MAG: hypothetical protein ACUVSB_04150 [Anaerolineae bacterium]